TGKSEYIAIVTIGKAGGNHASAFDTSFYHDRCIRHAGDDAISCREIVFVGFCATGKFGKQSSIASCNLFCETAMLVWIDLIETMCKHTDGGEVVFHCRFMRDCIDAKGKAANDQSFCFDEFFDEFLRCLASVFGVISCADD